MLITLISLAKNRHGQMLIEVIVAMGILVLFTTAFISLILGAYDGDKRGRERTEALFIAKEGLEASRSIARHNYSLLENGAFGIQQSSSGSGFEFTSQPTVHGNYIRTIAISSIHRDENQHISEHDGEEDLYTKNITSSVQWDGGHVQLHTLLANWTQTRLAFDILEQSGSGSIHATDLLPAEEGIAFKGEGDLSIPHVFFEEHVFDSAVVRDLEVEPREDRLYALSQNNQIGAEFIAYDLSNISNKDISIIGETELGADGMKFILSNDYAYAITGHGDKDIVRIRLSDFTISALWNMPGNTKPVDIAIDEDRGRAYILTSNIAQRKSVATLPPSLVTAGRSYGFTWPLFIENAHAQSPPSCNGQTATIYVENGFIVGGPDNGDVYTAGVTTLRGNNSNGGTDIIVGTSGNDIIEGRKGVDIICGGDGNDTISGSNGNDIIFGEGGDDIIRAGSNNDIVCGGDGNDNLRGQKHNDQIAGGNGTDTTDGDQNTDVCREGETIIDCEDTTSSISTCGVGALDTTNPTINTLSPSNNDTDIAVNSDLVITFDEAVNTENGDITIKRSSDQATIETIDVTSGQVTGGGTETITINPSADFEYGTDYYVLISADAFDDLAGNSYVGIGSSSLWNFTTLANLDTTNPTINALSPSDNDTDIAINSDLVITFDEAVNTENGDITIKYSSNNVVADIINVTSSEVSGDGTNTITINPLSDLDNSTEYYVQIASTAFDDLAGNSFGGIGDTTTWSFTTAASCTPDPLPTCNGQTATIYVNLCNTIVGSSDDGDTYGGAINGDQNVHDIIVGTDEVDNIDGKSGDDTICGGDGDDEITGGAGSDIIFGEGGNDILTGEGDNDVICGGDGDDEITGGGGNDQLDGGANTDDLNGTGQTDICRNGETLAGCEDTWSAISGCGVAADTTNPTTNTLLPADDSTDISVSSNLVVTFSEVVNVKSGNLSIYNASDLLVETIDITSGQVTGDGTTTITIDPSSDLTSGTSYYVQIDSTAIDDLAGNSYSGIDDKTSWNFTTAGTAPDTTNPTIDSLSPADNSTDIALTDNLVITFDESVFGVTGSITIKRSSDQVTIETIDVTSGQVTGSGTTTITINPSADFEYSTDYYVLIGADAFDDLAGNSYAGIGGSSLWNFTTLANPDTTNPTADSFSPVDGATNVSLGTSLSIVFDEAIIPVSGDVIVRRTSDNTIVDTIDVSSGQITGSGTTTISIDLAVTLDGLTDYSVQIDATAFDDMAGNSYAGIADTTTWNFTTVSSDITGPSITSLSPGNGETNVTTGTDLTLSFDESVNIGTGYITIYDASDNSVIEQIDVTSVQVTGGSTSIIDIDTQVILNASTSYYVHIDPTAFDDAVGNDFAGITDTSTWTFTSADVVTEEEQGAMRSRVPKPPERLYIIDITEEDSDSNNVTDASIIQEVDIKGTPLRVELVGGYAYILTDLSVGELSIMNTTTGNIVSCDLPGEQRSNDMMINGTTMYISRNQGIMDEFLAYTIDPTDPDNCEYILSHQVHGMNIEDGARQFSLLSDAGLIFLLSGYGLSDLQVINLEKNSALSLDPFNKQEGLCDVIHTVGSYIFTGCRGDGAITIFEGHKGAPQYFLWGTYTSPSFDISTLTEVPSGIRWVSNDKGTIVLRVRSAITEDALIQAPWIGPDGTISSVFTESSGSEISENIIVDGANFVQWKAYFQRTDEHTPVLRNVILTLE